MMQLLKRIRIHKDDVNGKNEDYKGAAKHPDGLKLATASSLGFKVDRVITGEISNDAASLAMLCKLPGTFDGHLVTYGTDI